MQVYKLARPLRQTPKFQYALAIYFFNYNFCRTHKTLRVTPAMAAGVTDRPWELEDVVAKFRELEDEREKELGPRRTRGK